MTPIAFTIDCAEPADAKPPIALGAGCVYIMRHTLLSYENPEFREALDDMQRAGISHLRCHYFLSDSANGVFDEGGGNCYSEDAVGNPIYSWDRIDRILDAWLKRGITPIFELSHVPDAMMAPGGDQNVRFPIPNDYKKYYALVFEVVKHLRERYGAERLRQWLFECPNEPDFGGLVHAAPEVKERCMNEFLRMYDTLCAAALAACPGIRLGGPASVFNPCLEAFLDHCVNGDNLHEAGRKGAPLDWVSAHKYALSLYRFDEDPDSCTLKTANILDHARLNKETMDRFGMGEKEYWLDEWGIISRFFDTTDMYPIVALRDTEYVALFHLKMLDGFYEMQKENGINVGGLAFCGEQYEMEREIFCVDSPPVSTFCGTRSLHTVRAIRKPIMNSFEMATKMGPKRLDVAGPEFGAQARVMASADEGGRVSILAYNFDEDILDPEKACPETEIRVQLKNIGAGASCRESYCLSPNHSNAYSKWIAMDRPKDPSEDQIGELRTQGRLESVAPPQVEEVGDGVALRLVLPGNSAILVTLAE